MTTGKKAGSAASNTLRNPKATSEEKTAAGSDLAQRPRSPLNTKPIKKK